MPSFTPLFTLLGALAAVILSIAGVTDPELSSNVQSAVVLAGALVVTGLAYCHHTTKQNTDAVSVAAAQAANEALRLAQAARPVAAPVTPLAGPSFMAAVGQAVEAARAGTVATAPPVIPAPAGEALPLPSAGSYVPTAGTPGSADDYPTEQIAAVRDVPTRAFQTIGH